MAHQFSKAVRFRRPTDRSKSVLSVVAIGVRGAHVARGHVAVPIVTEPPTAGGSGIHGVLVSCAVGGRARACLSRQVATVILFIPSFLWYNVYTITQEAL
jgi:hypothetical protein